MRWRALAPALLLLAAPAAAQENRDLDLIPNAVQAAPPPPAEDKPQTSDGGQRIYLENAASLASRRAMLVPLPPPATPDWEERLFLDMRKDWQLAPKLSLAYSGRLNFRAEDTLAFPSHENVRHDFRELYASWEPAERVWLDVGRINLKSGVAAGLNPTDFFKTRAVVEPLSADPAVLREDRLGAFMLRGQRLFEGGALTAAVAPKLDDPGPIYTNLNLPTLRPMFDRTNSHDRVLLKASADLGADVNPELLYYREGSASRFGANLTRSVGQKTVLYGEWAGGRQSSLIDQALAYGRETGTIPGFAPSALPESTHQGFQNQLALGASYTTESKVTFNLEYHYSEAAFSPQDWRNWFRVGEANTGRPPITSALWYIRNYALDQQQKLSRHETFLRADWNDAFVPHLEITGFVSTDLHDGSSLVQMTADYDLSNQWSVGALAAGALGAKRSSNGSLPQSGSLLLKLERFF